MKLRNAVMLLAILVARSTEAGTGARLYKSGPIQVSASGRYVWVANPDNDSVSRIDTAAADAVVEYPLPLPGPHAPHFLSLKEDGSEVWVACRDSDRVYVLSGANGAVLARIDLPWGSGPYAIALSRDQKHALVALYRAPGIALLDVAARSLVKVLPTVHYYAPVGLAWTEDGKSAWVTHLLAVEMGGDPFLSRVEVAGDDAWVTTKLRALSSPPQSSSALAAPFQIAEGGYLNFRGSLAQLPSITGKQEMWIPTQYESEHPDAFTPDSIAQSVIRHVDLATRTLPNTDNDKIVLTAVQVHDPAVAGNPYVGPGWNAHAAGPIDLGFTADGQTSYILGEQSDRLVVVPTSTPAANLTGAPPLVEIAVGFRPIGVTLSPTASRAYVANQLSRDVSVIDTDTNQELKRVATTPTTGEPFSPSRLRGARLFHAAVDPDGLGRISANDKVACATCHPNGEQDGRVWNLNVLPGKHGPRRTMSLLGIGQTFAAGEKDPINGTWGEIHLSGDRDEIQDFEHTFQGPIMGGKGFLGAAVQPELGPPNAGLSSDLDALADYVTSLPAAVHSPYRAANGALSASAVRGASYFMGNNYPARKADSGCATCHVPATGYVDHTSHDVGQARDANEKELNARNPAWTVNTRTLLGVWATPSYQGGAATDRINDIVDLLRDQAGQAKHGTPKLLTGHQLGDLADFVRSIDGALTPADVVNARDTTPPRMMKVEAASLTLIDVWFDETVDAASAGNPASYLLVDLATGQPVAVTAAQWDGQNGDLVRLTTQLAASCGGYRLSPAPGAIIHDVADWASNGTANTLDPSDPANTHDFYVTSPLTITLGGSGYETLTVPVHDVATIPGLATWEMDEVWLWSGSRGFVRFDWSAAFAAATAIVNSADILDASFSLEGDWGDAQTVELRRVLLSWSDPAGVSDWNQNPVGGPTATAHVHPNLNWHAQNAAKRTAGVDGRNLADYDAANDLGFTPDLVVTPRSVNERTRFGGPDVSDAFRFWFDHPKADYGYALEQQKPQLVNDLRFQNGETGLRAHGPVLTITYRLPVAGPAAPGEVSAAASAKPLLAVKAANGQVRLGFEDLGAAPATSYNVYEGALGLWFSHGGVACNVAAPLNGGRREWTFTPAAGGRSIQVTASTACGEGPMAAGWPPGNPDCPP